MLDSREIEIAIVEGLKKYLSQTEVEAVRSKYGEVIRDSEGKKIESSDAEITIIPCEVIRANQTGEIPPYPYVSYTITTPAQYRSGTYSEAPDGTRFRSYLQTWSFTVQSDDADECLFIAMKAFDWFSLVGRIYLNDENIVVSNIGNINNRDNLISIQYEYRYGFDVTFRLLHTIKMTEEEIGGYIEKIDIKQEV